MARKRSNDPVKTFKRRLAEGRGKGHGPSYMPYLKVRDVPSLGFSTRIKGWKTGRMHHLLSRLELHYFYYLEWLPEVIDIREQYPLPLDTTLEIADRLKIRHPIDTKSKQPQVMTTDFVVDVETAEGVVTRAISVKPFSKLSSSRVIEKLELERTFWSEQDFKWSIVTEHEIPSTLARNVEIVHPAKNIQNFPELLQSSIYIIESLLFKLIAISNGSLSRSALEIDQRLGLEPGTCLWTAKHLIANKVWLVDMTKPLNFSKFVSIARNERSNGKWVTAA